MILESPVGFDAGKKYGEQKLCNVKIWIEETLTLSKARRVIREIILFLKYQKQTTIAILGKMSYVVVSY